MIDSGSDAPPPYLAVQEHRRHPYLVSTDPARLEIAAIHGFLAESYWARGIPLATVRRSLAHSLCFGVYDTASGGAQAGFARVVSDYATFAYLGDVFILERHRGRGLSKWLLECILAHPALGGLRRWNLITADAHDLYRRFGFVPLDSPEGWMEICDGEAYSD